jgi:cardiolipin synthase A/B
MKEVFLDFWPYATAALSLLLSVVSSGHAILYKRDSRAAVGWVGVIWLAPLLGPILYILLGINRIQRRASSLRGDEPPMAITEDQAICAPARLGDLLPADCAHLTDIARLNERVTGLALLCGNRIEPLINGDAAYPEMLAAIREAEHSVTLTTYIFDYDAAGNRFVEALTEAVQRGVEVRVLIDAVGARYSLPPVTHRLRLKGVTTARFMLSYVPWSTPYLNLRSHRKILVADGKTAFTGGINIRAGNLVKESFPYPTRDVHFRVTGPVVQELQATFAEDWEFTTGEQLEGERWFPRLAEAGTTPARVIPDGPDHHLNKMSMAFHGALATAKRSVRIVTPYFLPDAALIGALNTCALRGVDVDIVLPARNNLRLVAWASMAQMWQLLEWDCRVWLTPPPFDHSKLFVVDEAWSLIGSANWDPRSLRLNFEIGLECYCPELATKLNKEIEAKIDSARPLLLDEVNRRGLPTRMRDGMARLFAPYL